MPQPIFIQQENPFAQGISAFGGALNQALQQRQQLALQQQLQQENRIRNENALTALLSSIPEESGIYNQTTALQNALQSGQYEPEVLQNIIGQMVLQEQKAQLTPQKVEQGSVGKKLNELKANIISNVIENAPHLEGTKENIARLKELSKGLTGILGSGKALIKSADATEFNALGLTAIEPAIAILAPRGTIQQRKFEAIKENFALNAWDNRYKMEGKINALESFVKQADKYAQTVADLYNQYGENIPVDALIRLNTEINRFADQELEKSMKLNETNLPSKFETPNAKMAKENKGAIIQNEDTGEMLISNGQRWVKYKG